MATATFTNGNIEVTATVTGEARIWEKGDLKRAYYDVTFAGKRTPITSLYEVLAGSTRDNTVTVNGRVFAYQLAQCDSNTKRAAAVEAVEKLAEQLA